jgi:hypothetical protein
VHATALLDAVEGEDRAGIKNCPGSRHDVLCR